jgi:mannan endo-1,4-beta-mannosidase
MNRNKYRVVVWLIAANSFSALAVNNMDIVKQQAVDKQITDETASLLYNLQQSPEKRTLLGQHDGVWLDEKQNLNAYMANLSGTLPGIVSYDFMFITHRNNTKDSWYRKAEDNIREKIIACNKEGIYITLCWHYNDPYTGTTFYTKELPNNKFKKESFISILEEGENHELYKNDLRKIADFAASLRDQNGQLIPFIFRPFHEFDGNWFWWGADYNSPEEFKSVWKFTVHYLRDSLNVHNLLYAFSPDIKFDSQEQYLLRYPGDEYVDILGFDDYGDFKHDKKTVQKAKKRIRIIAQLAEEKKKIAALTEVGYFIRKNKSDSKDVERLKNLLEVISEMHHFLSYVVFWSNGTHDFCVPQEGDPGEAIFAEFLQQPFFILNKEQAPPFKLAILPDVQTYTKMYPEIFKVQTQWLAEHNKDFRFVLQQGDITDWNSIEQWEAAREAFFILDDKIPYTFVPGNHDMGNDADIRNTDNFNRYFPYDKYVHTSHFGGAFQTDKMDNTWHTFTAGGIQWLILSLEFGTRNGVLEWAEKVIKKHPAHKVIINTHDYMYSDNTRMGNGDDWLPQSYGIGKEMGENAVNNGEQIWEKLISRYKNIFMVLSGHVLHSGTGTLVSKGKHGNDVYQMLANYQEGVEGVTKGGNGYMRIITIDIKKKIMDVKTYSPYINYYNTAPNQQFTFENVQF